ncbi:unnamed protein product [Urochloa humidicola]
MPVPFFLLVHPPRSNQYLSIESSSNQIKDQSNENPIHSSIPSLPEIPHQIKISRLNLQPLDPPDRGRSPTFPQVPLSIDEGRSMWPRFFLAMASDWLHRCWKLGLVRALPVIAGAVSVLDRRDAVSCGAQRVHLLLNRLSLPVGRVRRLGAGFRRHVDRAAGSLTPGHTEDSALLAVAQASECAPNQHQDGSSQALAPAFKAPRAP